MLSNQKKIARAYVARVAEQLRYAETEQSFETKLANAKKTALAQRPL
jgi:hypothetical protein